MNNALKAAMSFPMRPPFSLDKKLEGENWRHISELNIQSFESVIAWFVCRALSTVCRVTLGMGSVEVRHLDRQGELPSGPKRYRHGQDTCNATCPTQEERQGIWLSLGLMQGPRCAYCEGPMGEGSRHIEHFR
ncbi:hypothetical protein [Pseudomonas sp. MHK4]